MKGRKFTSNYYQNVSKRCSYSAVKYGGNSWCIAIDIDLKHAEPVAGQSRAKRYVEQETGTQMPPECEEIEGHEEKTSCIDGRIKEHLQFSPTFTLCGANIYPRSFLHFRFLFSSYVAPLVGLRFYLHY